MTRFGHAGARPEKCRACRFQSVALDGLFLSLRACRQVLEIDSSELRLS
jgi:hypothetical protein